MCPCTRTNLVRLMRKLDATQMGSAPTADVAGRVSGGDALALLQADPVTAEDMAAALAATSASTHKFAPKYEAWTRDFGST
jgi:hypothetical protein